MDKILKEKIKKFEYFLNQRIYTEWEIKQAQSDIIKEDMSRWNRLVRITQKEFHKIFK